MPPPPLLQPLRVQSPSQVYASHAFTPPAPMRSPSTSTAGKVPIPRMRSEAEAGSVAAGSREGGDKHRISHACEPCRSRKTKCSGERPACGHCREHGLVCAYGDGKRDRAKK